METNIPLKKHQNGQKYNFSYSWQKWTWVLSQVPRTRFQCHWNQYATHCDNSGIPAVAICDLSQCVIKAVTAQTESNNTENVFWVLGRVPRFTFDMNMKSCIFAHFGVISLVYLLMCMHISYKAYNRCTQETFLKGSDLDLNLGVYPRLLWNISEKLCFEPSQIATVTNCDNSGIPAVTMICRNLWSKP